MVTSLVLLAPAGLIRPKHLSGRSRLLYSMGIVPEPLLKWGVARRLKAGPMYEDESKKKAGVRANVLDAVGAEVEGDAFNDPDAGNKKPSSVSVSLVTSSNYELEKFYNKSLYSYLARSRPPKPLSYIRPNLTVDAAVVWQLNNHTGFVHSFMSSVRFAPITGQQRHWSKLSQRQNKLLIVAGTRDPIIIADEIREDAEQLLGKEKVVFRKVEAAHDFPIVESEEVVRLVCEFWGL
jgi:hypothetical protein